MTLHYVMQNHSARKLVVP